VKYWHDADAPHDAESWQDCRPMTSAGRVWILNHIFTAADNPVAAGQDVPALERWHCLEAECVPLEDVAGYCLLTTEAAEDISFMDEDGVAHEEAAASGVLGTFTGTMQGNHPNTGAVLTATFANGYCTHINGTAIATYGTTMIQFRDEVGGVYLLRIDTDGRLKR
jgi:hypothetical protein